MVLEHHLLSDATIEVFGRDGRLGSRREHPFVAFESRAARCGGREGDASVFRRRADFEALSGRNVSCENLRRNKENTRSKLMLDTHPFAVLCDVFLDPHIAIIGVVVHDLHPIVS